MEAILLTVKLFARLLTNCCGTLHDCGSSGLILKDEAPPTDATPPTDAPAPMNAAAATPTAAPPPTDAIAPTEAPLPTNATICGKLCTANCGEGSPQANLTLCQEVCGIAADPATCVTACNAYLNTTVETLAPTTAPPCECIALCDQCNVNGSNTADCQTVCQIAGDPATCYTNCCETLHDCGSSGLILKDEAPPTDATPPTEAPAPTAAANEPPTTTTEATAPCECIALCNQCNADGSNTADCKTVCDIASDPNTCYTKCCDTLHDCGSSGLILKDDAPTDPPAPTEQATPPTAGPTSLAVVKSMMTCVVAGLISVVALV